MDLSALGIETNFSVWDWIIVAAYLLTIVGVGVYIKRYVVSTADFIVAGRGLKTLLAVASMVGTELGLVTVMYASQKGFTGGFAAIHIALAGVAGTLVVGLTGFLMVPLRRMKVMTIPEFYEKRFGRRVRIFGGIILAFSGIINMGMFLKAGSLFVMGITGISEGHLKVIMSVMLGMVLLYTVLGGMVSIVILDYIQFVVLSISLLVMTYFSIKTLGWTNIVDTVTTLKGEAGFNPFHGAGFGLVYVLWIFFEEILGMSVWQPMAIRACSTESAKTVRRMYGIASIGFLVRLMLPVFFGVCAFVFISQHEGLRGIFLPEGGADSDTTLMAMPFFMSQVLPVGVIGIVVAGMLAALMSTHDVYLLCWASVLTRDVIGPLFKNGLSQKASLLITRIFIVVIGLYILVWGLWYPLGQDLWDYMLITGAIYFVGAVVLLIFGIYWKRASKVGAYLALITGLGSILGLAPVRNRVLGLLRLENLREYLSTIASEKVSAVIGLSAVTLASILMVVSSWLFPDRVSSFIDYKKEKE